VIAAARTMNEPKQYKKISFFLYLMLATLAVLLDLGFGFIPVLGALIGFVFTTIVSIQLFFFGYNKGNMLRFAALLISWVLEFFLVFPPTNLIYITLVYLINNIQVKRSKKRPQEQGATPI
jgi:hypothetical protein